MSEQVVTVSLAEAAAAEDAATEAITDEAFLPSAPLTAAPAAWVNGTTYAKNALVTRTGQVYRSQEAGNKEHDPAEDTDFVHWSPVSVTVGAPLIGSGYTNTAAVTPSRKEP